MGNRKYDKREKSLSKKRKPVAEPNKEKGAQQTIETLKDEPKLLVKEYDTEKDIEAPNFIIPKTLVTTSRRPSLNSVKFARELENIFPNAHYFDRGSMDDLVSLAKDAQSQEYTHILIVEDCANSPVALTFVNLPHGHCLVFKLSSVKLSKDVRNYGKSSSHIPELIMNNFNTGVGKLVGKFLASLFPQPDFKGRQVVTFHNQRDFIFFRRHRYIFDEKEMRNVRTQEIGPQFTLKLKRITKKLGDDMTVYDQNDLKWEKKERSLVSVRSANNKMFIN